MLESQITRRPARNTPMVLAAFSYRYDAHLVPDLLSNLAPSVHGYVAWNDQSADVALTSEPARRTHILQEARRLGADWIMAVDPDERYEDNLAHEMPRMLARGEGNLWTFSVREMFDPEHYRVDGVWGGKSSMRLFPMSAVKGDLTAALHGRWISDSSGYALRDSRINMYHLRMATVQRRSLRRDLYAAADPTRAAQKIGYDYLADERGMRLERIPASRAFSPAFVEDGGLWSPEPEQIGEIVSDRLEHRLQFVAQSIARQGHASAFHALCDLGAASPQDTDLPLLAASHALTAGLADEAQSIAAAQLERQPESLAARLLAARALHLMGRVAEGLSVAEGLPKDSLLCQDVCNRLGREGEDFTSATATWRRWTKGAATCVEGSRIARSDLAIVVIGFRAQDTLAAAVASVIDQDEPAEIIVVNTGGGDVRKSLAPVLDRIRLIAIEEPLFVGAARNVGIDASRAPCIAFLAGDCLAEPGWTAGRLRRHRAGALMVATPVMPQRDARLVAEAANRLLYWGRRPDTPLAYVAPFGRSYHRRIFDLVGPFPPGLRINEDDRLNRLADQIALCDWAPEVLTQHRDPTTLVQLLRAQVRRGENRADHAPFRSMSGTPDGKRRLADEMRGRRAASLRMLVSDPATGGWRRWAMAAVQWLANRADSIGIARGLARVAKAERLAADQTEPRHLAQAAALDPQDWRKALTLGGVLAASENPDACAEFRRGLALAPGEGALSIALVRCLEGKGDHALALQEAERAALAAPLSRRHWEVAADAALRAKRADLACVFALQALALAPQDATAHRRMANCHIALGNPVLAMFRNHAAQRLEDKPA
jgi:Glycosyl transferase family 2